MMDKACCIFPDQNLPGSAWKDYDKLRKAVRSRDAGLVKRLINGGALVNRRYDDYSENTPLHLAVTSRCLEIVKILLDNGANINATNAILDTPLTMAAKMEDTAIVDLLLSYNVHQYFNMRDNLGHLHIACMRNKLEVVRKLVLVDHGKTVSEAVMSSSLTWPGFTALHFAVYYGCTKTVKFLLECGVDIMVQDAKKLTPLQWADLRRNEEIIDLLLTAHKHEFKNSVSTNSLSHFHIACTRNDPLIVEHFLKLGADINLEVKVSESKFWQGWKPIHLAMYYDCPNVVKMLLNYKAQYEFSPMNRCQSRLLEYTFVTGNMSIYNLFANREKESEAIKEIEPISDFLLACMNNDYDYVEEWLRRNSRNSKYNDPFPCGCTPLHLTIKYDSYDAFKLLLAWDADITTQDPWGKTPLHAAFERKSPDFICKILSDVNDDTENVTDNFGLSILHILCITDYTELIEEFLLKGCDVNARVGVKSPQWAGSTPMHFAFEFEHENQDEEFVEDVVRLLLKYKANIYIKNDSIFDHFDLIFHGMDKGGQLSEYEELLYKNLIKVLSSPTKQRKYSNCGVSPLHALCMNPFADIKTLKKFLISHGHVINQTIEKPESRRFHKCTPLHLALQRHDFVKAEVLLNAGADPLLINGNGNTPLECAFPLPRPLKMSEKVVKCLFQCGITIERLKPSHFFIACCTYIFEFVKHVLENLRDPSIRKYYLNYHNSVNQTALHTIALHKNLGEYDSANRKRMIELLLKNGANVDARNHMLETPLYLAKDYEVICLLLQHGANVNIQNIHGSTLLHKICRDYYKTFRNNDTLVALLKNGADINIEDYQGLTCLMMINSFDQNNEKFAVPLLEHIKKSSLIGFDISQKNKDVYLEILNRCRNVFDVSYFENACKKEIKLMMSKKIDRCTSVYDILFKSLNSMTQYCRNDILLSLLQSISNDFPIYGDFVLLQIKSGKIRLSLLQNSMKCFALLMKTPLPRACSEMILRHLSDMELVNIIKSVERSNTNQ